MRKKIRRKKEQSATWVESKLLIVICSVLLFIIAATAAFYLGPQSKPCANSISCTRDLSGQYKSDIDGATFMRSQILVPPKIADASYKTTVLGTSATEKRIEINLTTQQLAAFEGDKKVYEFLVSTGKWGQTPTGTFHIWIKLRYTLMAGGNKAIGTYYYLPNVPYVMYFYNEAIQKTRGFGIHGTYWHNNFGHPMSHGCINMRTEDAEKLYNWANPPTTDNSTTVTDENKGTTIVIYGQAPKE